MKEIKKVIKDKRAIYPLYLQEEAKKIIQEENIINMILQSNNNYQILSKEAQNNIGERYYYESNKDNAKLFNKQYFRPEKLPYLIFEKQQIQQQ